MTAPDPDFPTVIDRATVRWAADAKLTGLLMATIEHAGDAVSADVRTAAAEQHAAAMARDVVLERALLTTVDVLRSAGVEPLVLKGAAVAHLDYPDPSWRSFSDVDLLVRSADYDVAVATLVGRSYRRLYPEPRPGFDRRFGKGTVLRAPGDYEVDLHRTFVVGPFGVLLDLDELWRHTTRFTLGGTELAALDRTGRTLHAAFQVALDGRHTRAAAVRDLGQLTAAPDLDLDALTTLAARSQAGCVVRAALDRLESSLGLSPAADALRAGLPGDESSRRWLARYDDPTSSYAQLSAAGLAALSRRRDRVAMALALGFPQRDYVRDRHAGRLARWTRNVKAVLRGFRR